MTPIQISRLKLFHISQNNLHDKTVTPSIPDNFFTKHGYEDNKTPRVCFGPSIGRCLRALSQKLTNAEFYVYNPAEECDVYRPSIKEVPDAKITGEMRVLKPTKLQADGKIRAIGDNGKDVTPYKNGDNTAYLYDWEWKWVVRYR